MHILPPVRPERSIERLTAILEPIAEKVKVVPRKRLTWLRKGKQQMYLFLEGELSLLRASDGLVVVTVYEPHLFGIAEMIQPTQGHFLRAERESTILRIDADEAAALFRARGVWEDVAALLSYHTAYLIFRDAQVLQQRTYSVIRNHLQEMILLPEEARMRTTILEYIQDRTLLSRSSILNVLSALKQGEYIAFKRGGYLLEVRHLPESF
ncbi:MULTISPECIES: winged helix-turn-helix transcriptional regulator [Enterobacter]|uniref:Helix-turn-helix domain-containing protein n=2 Tax=Enterobacter cloacae complex TaxID=354276 RepID=A0A7H8UDH5_ENTCL|nr:MULTISPECIES: winged helix-turn-helix transcriptional regulator [Enterobacter]MBE4853162.1 helix-turn-helix domain-containing protein [Enterobacter pasteurii]MBE4861690.1 helix-turn-helix domain-containing protein [Enterobacter cloacae complex sp. P40C2]MBE4875445.1 helix-turn-helix domain-containing protein [Enterobacter cloacae complex sp. P40C]MCI2290368.1 helix-turn-helix domain-containing protein [Enterobacter sp. I4]MDE4080224.1 helix-turn-helix domain-containing protein [Enterobacter